jgi:hypothetical protein
MEQKMPSVTTTGTGSDSLVLMISEDAYLGDALFTVSVDGRQQGGVFTATASHAAGSDQNFTFKGDWAPGAHTVTVNFLNDAWGGTPATDRNLYVDAMSYDAAAFGVATRLASTGSKTFTVNDTTPLPSVNGTTIRSPSDGAIIDSNGNAWTLVQSASSGLQIAINGQVDPITANVVLLQTLNGNMVQENTSGNWYSETGPNGSWAQIAAPPVPTPVTVGSGSDTLVLSMSEDAYLGDAQFTVSVDGKQQGGTFTTTALHAAGASQTFTFKGDWAAGAHTVAVNFLNDVWGGTPATDRNLHVNAISYDGAATGQSAALKGAGPRSFSVTDNTAPAAPSGSDTIVLTMSEDADGPVGATGRDAQFTVSVDGNQIGGLRTVTASHAAGQTQTFNVQGDFAPGQHAITVTFANNSMTQGDKAAFNDGGDRNLYVNSVTYDGKALTNAVTPIYTSPLVPPNGDVFDPGNAVFLAQDTTVIPLGTTLQPTTTPAAITVGAGSDQFLMMMSEDPFQGDAQFTVSIDGVQIGGTLTTTAVNWHGQQQAFLVKGNFGSGAHTVSVNFLNDAGVLNPQGLAYDAQDRNLYIDSITYDDRPVPGTPYELFSNGPHGFSVPAGGLPNQETIAASTVSSTIALSGATITASSGDHMFFVTGSHDTLSATGGNETVQQYGGNANTIQTGAGNDMISLTGTGNAAGAGAGQNQIYDSGTANRIVLPAAGNGFDDIFGPMLLNGDTLDMRAMLQAAHWNGDQSVIGNYLHAASANNGQDTMISVTPNGSGSSYNVADLHGVGAVTLSGLLAHAVVA